MGGYGSGRTKRHLLTDECLTFDLAYLRQRGFLTGKMRNGGLLTQKHNKVTFTIGMESNRVEMVEKSAFFHIERFHASRWEEHEPWPVWGEMNLISMEAGTTVWLPLVCTFPHYGGVRYWFVAPCCGQRARVLHLPDGHSVPLCQKCLGLHYRSQVQTYQQRHATFEKYLLANYGYTWAKIKYDELREHHLKVTPAIAAMRDRSVMERNLEMIRLLVRTERLIWRMRLHDFRSLYSDEDRRTYLEHLSQQEKERDALDAVHLLIDSMEIEQRARTTNYDAELIENILHRGDEEEERDMQQEGEAFFKRRFERLEAAQEALEQGLKAA